MIGIAWHVVFRKTRYGKKEFVDYNSIECDDLAKVIGLEKANERGYDFEVGNLPPQIRRMVLDWYDTTTKKSGIILEMDDIPLPTIPIPYNDVFLPTTQQMKDAGLGEKIHPRTVKLRKDDFQERQQWRGKLGSSHNLYVDIGNNNWHIQTNNCLDTAMLAFFLVNTLPQTLFYFAQKPELLLEDQKLPTPS